MIISPKIFKKVKSRKKRFQFRSIYHNSPRNTLRTRSLKSKEIRTVRWTKNKSHYKQEKKFKNFSFFFAFFKHEKNIRFPCLILREWKIGKDELCVLEYIQLCVWTTINKLKRFPSIRNKNTKMEINSFHLSRRTIMVYFISW